MPTLNKTYSLTITPEQFLEACDPLELQEVDLLLNSVRFRNRMRPEGPENEFTLKENF